MQLCSTLNVTVAETGLKFSQSDERRVLRTSRCTVLSGTILNLTYSLNIVADLGLICVARGWVYLWAAVNNVMKLRDAHSAAHDIHRRGATFTLRTTFLRQMVTWFYSFVAVVGLTLHVECMERYFHGS